MDDSAFLGSVVDTLASLPGVHAVALGGSRAEGTHTDSSDWDLGLYYRGPFDPEDLREVGWPGEVSDIGGWGGGVFNGGAWLTIEGRRVDVHYRDLGSIEHEMSEAVHGRFRVEPLLFHLAGIPSYLVVGELSVNRVLYGELPRPHYPDKLRVAASDAWWASASHLFDYAEHAHARAGRFAQCLGLTAQAASHAAHAVLAARGEWPSNEKTLLTRAGLASTDGLFSTTRPDPDALTRTVQATQRLCAAALEAARTA